jgi:hypothetical protein
MAILGQKGSATGIPNISFMASTTWTPSCNYEAYVYVIGGGGNASGNYNNNAVSVTGGSAGGCVISKLTLVSGTEYTITVGSGGAARTMTGHEYRHGNAGGASSFSGSNITTMSAGGGSAGKYWRTGTNGADYGVADAGGTATGSNIGCNFVGGRAGATTALRQATGGGAVGLWDTGRTPTEKAVGTDDYDSAMGGNLSLYTRSDQDGSNGWTTNDEALPVALSPFPDLFTWRSDYAYAYVSDTHKMKGQQPMYAGLQELGPNSSSDDGLSDSTYNVVTASPFCGGNAVATERATVRTANGCLGSGSGACYSEATTSNLVTGAGGDGAVLIFPTSMG